MQYQNIRKAQRLAHLCRPLSLAGLAQVSSDNHDTQCNTQSVQSSGQLLAPQFDVDLVSAVRVVARELRASLFCA